MKLHETHGNAKAPPSSAHAPRVYHTRGRKSRKKKIQFCLDFGAGAWYDEFMRSTDAIAEREVIIMPTITPAEFAAAAGTDAKTARRFLRSVIVDTDARPGKGGRWAIDASLLDELVARFDARGARRTATITELPNAPTA